MIILTPNAFGAQYPVLIPGGVAENRGMNFMPNVIEIEKGDTIIWKNLERGVVHTVTSTSGLFDEKLLNCTYFEDGVGICGGHPKATFSYTFEEFGTYNYNCKIHSWMNGIVKILEFGGEAEIQIHGFAGSMFIDKSQYVVTAGKAAEIKIYGGVKTWSSSGGERVFFTITYPDGSTDEQSSPIKRSNGEYKFPLNVNYDEVGTYNVHATFNTNNIGTANFVVVAKTIPEELIPKEDHESLGLIGSVSKGGLTIDTDLSSYKKGEMITISGITPYLALHQGNQEITIQILDNRNNIVTVSQIKPNNDRTYSLSINSEGPMWKIDGIYTVKANFLNESVDTMFVFSTAGAPPEKVYENFSTTFLKLDSIDGIFNVQEPDPRASVTVSGKLSENRDVNLGRLPISDAVIKLEFTGFTVDEREYKKISTDSNGRFNWKIMMPVGEGYTIQAVFGGWDDYNKEFGLHRDLLSSRSQTESFDVRLSPQSQLTQSDDNPYAGIAGLFVIVVVIVGIIIGIKGARKKRSTQYQSTSSLGGSTAPQQQAYQQAPSKPKRIFGKRKKAKPQAVKDYSYTKLDLDPMYCMNPKCGSPDLQTKANGENYCTKCGWNK